MITKGYEMITKGYEMFLTSICFHVQSSQSSGETHKHDKTPQVLKKRALEVGYDILGGTVHSSSVLL